MREHSGIQGIDNSIEYIYKESELGLVEWCVGAFAVSCFLVVCILICAVIAYGVDYIFL